MKRLLIITAFLFALGISVKAQSTIVKDFKPVCDSLSILIQERNTVNGKLSLQAVMKRGSSLDFYFTESLSDYPWYEGDTKWFRSTLKSLFPEKYSKYGIGGVYTKNIDIKRLEVASLSFKGSPFISQNRALQPEKREDFITAYNAQVFPTGLSGRNIALWQSHGYFYDCNARRWNWQRPCLFQTVEDMYTQSYVLPFLVPMLENAGAYVMLPRERDVQRNEVIADNDPSCGARGTATYTEDGRWTDAGNGFADTKDYYVDQENPFAFGTCRKAECTPADRKSKAEVAVFVDESAYKYILQL